MIELIELQTTADYGIHDFEVALLVRQIGRSFIVEGIFLRVQRSVFHHAEFSLIAE